MGPFVFKGILTEMIWKTGGTKIWICTNLLLLVNTNVAFTIFIYYSYLRICDLFQTLFTSKFVQIHCWVEFSILVEHYPKTNLIEFSQNQTGCPQGKPHYRLTRLRCYDANYFVIPIHVRDSIICTINKYAKLASLFDSVWTNNVLVALAELRQCIKVIREYYGGRCF